MFWSHSVPSRGGAAGLADVIGDALTEAGCAVVMSPASDVYDLTGIDAVIVAGALYANRWHRDARRFVRRNTAALRRLPVCLVSTGPVDDSAERQGNPPPNQVAKLVDRIGARGHSAFGGRLTPDSPPARWRRPTPAIGAPGPRYSGGLNRC